MSQPYQPQRRPDEQGVFNYRGPLGNAASPLGLATTPISALTYGAGQAQNLLQNALHGGGASISDILQRVAQNQRMMSAALAPPAASTPPAPYQATPTPAGFRPPPLMPSGMAPFRIR